MLKSTGFVFRKFRFIFLFMCVALMALTFSLSSAIGFEDATSLTMKARGLELSNNNSEAVKFYFAALGLDPANLATQDALVNAAEVAISKAPDNFESHLDLGNAYACRSDFALALREFQFAHKAATDQRKRDIATASTTSAQMFMFGGEKSRSAAKWLSKMKVNNAEVLKCPICNTATDIIPAITSTPTPEQQNGISNGNLYLALGQFDPSGLPLWYCMQCHKTFASAASSPAVLATVDFKFYIADLQRRINRAWFPPRGNKDKKVVIKFKVHRGGELSNLRILESCGVAVADNAALKAAENAAPYRPLPAGVIDDVDFEAALIYRAWDGSHVLTLKQIVL